MDTDKKYECLSKIYDSTYHLLFLYSMERCHNSIYLTRFLNFCRIFFTYGQEITILNVIFRINILADLVRFYADYVYKDSRKKRGREVFYLKLKEKGIYVLFC